MTKTNQNIAAVLPMQKECRKCGEVKPLSEFYTCGGEKHSYCKECEKKRMNGKEEACRRRSLYKKRIEAKPGYKLCVRCEKIKPVSRFSKGSKDTTLGLASYCKPCLAHWEKIRRASSPVQRLKLSLNTAKGSARRKKLPCTLTISGLEEMWKSQKGKCFYTGVSMSYAGNHLPESVSIDRLDNSKGYTQDNIVLSCVAVNRMKYIHSVEEFLRWCKLVVENYEEV